ncbi:MAG: hypothetical protein H2069_02260 [Legionella sp.]|nr:hypothetical protein [Legionella sp.]
MKKFFETRPALTKFSTDQSILDAETKKEDPYGLMMNLINLIKPQNIGIYTKDKFRDQLRAFINSSPSAEHIYCLFDRCSTIRSVDKGQIISVLLRGLANSDCYRDYPELINDGAARFFLNKQDGQNLISAFISSSCAVDNLNANFSNFLHHIVLKFVHCKIYNYDESFYKNLHCLSEKCLSNDNVLDKNITHTLFGMKWHKESSPKTIKYQTQSKYKPDLDSPTMQIQVIKSNTSLENDTANNPIPSRNFG